MTTCYSYYSLLIFLLILNQQTICDCEPIQDKQALISFISKTPHSPRLDWNTSISACQWVGVTCDSTRTHIHTLRLPAVGLLGPIPHNTIGRLTKLRVLSIHSNRLSGSFPNDFSNLTLLRALYVSNNQLSGEFPRVLTNLSRLARLDLSYNNFSGPIPYFINNLTNLNGLFLQSNRLSGPIPNISLDLVEFNVSNNELNGSVPRKLSLFPQSCFAGNVQLCGGPLPPCKGLLIPPSSSPSSVSIVPSSPAEISHTKKNKMSKWVIIGISVFAAAVLLCVVLCLVFCCVRRGRRVMSKSVNGKAEVGAGGTSSSKDDLTSGGGGTMERSKLIFVNNERGGYRFNLEDLLRASAEVLGKGSAGTSYKAVMEEGTTVVVKRLKDVVAGKSEFEVQMEVMGRCKHENVAALRAYYYSQDEKLLVYDYFPSGSLSALLHGSRGRTSLDWDNRMRIAISTARGLAYLHASNNLIHGNIKSSNILLHPKNGGAVISDFGLTPLFTPNTTSSTTRMAGYRAPETMQTLRSTFKSDVYSFGVLLLELLTGKSPTQASFGDEGIDLPRWVQSVVREEWTAEVFDVELMRYHNIEEEMVQLLQIAMACVAMIPDQRPSMSDALRMIEEINRSESGTDDGIRQSSDDPSKGSDGQTPMVESRTSPLGFTP